MGKDGERWIFAQTAYRSQAVAFDEQLAGHRSVPDQVEGLARGENGQAVFRRPVTVP